jgi:hypothetical protein
MATVTQLRVRVEVRADISVRVRKSRPKPSNGYTVWRGPSRQDGAPIVVVITGLLTASANPKTGPMPQVWVFREDVKPADAVKSGEDESVCNNCPFRPTVRRANDPDGFACYVRADGGVNQVWRSYHNGLYPPIEPARLASLLKFRRVRGGAYGNLSNAPLWVSKLWADNAQKHTQYDHGWPDADPGFAELAMASVGSPEEREAAKRAGWRTFRVKRADEPVLDGERECPAQDKYRAAGRYVTCHDCGACHGNNGTPGKADIVVDDHGPTSELTKSKRAASRFALTTI